MSDDDDLPPDPDEGLPEDDGADRRRLNRKRAKADREREEEDGFWRSCLATPIGRRAIYRLFQLHGLWSQPFAVGPNGFPQTEATWFKAGAVQAVRNIHDELQKLDHDLVFDMLCENHPAYAAARRRTVKHG